MNHFWFCAARSSEEANECAVFPHQIHDDTLPNPEPPSPIPPTQTASHEYLCPECQHLTATGTLLPDGYDQQYELAIYFSLYQQWPTQIDDINDQFQRHSFCRGIKAKLKKL
jgi:hypothetical protein